MAWNIVTTVVTWRYWQLFCCDEARQNEKYKAGLKRASKYLHVTNTKTIVPCSLIHKIFTIFKYLDIAFSMHAFCSKY